MNSEPKYYLFPRRAWRDDPAGITVSKNPELPVGDFRITEYKWGRVSLWFVDLDKFTASERNAAYTNYVMATTIVNK